MSCALSSSHTPAMKLLLSRQPGALWWCRWQARRHLHVGQTAQRALPSDTWDGLAAWRAAVVDERREWGERTAAERAGGAPPPLRAPAPPPASLADWGRQVLLTADPLAKAELTHRGWQLYCAGALPVGVAEAPPKPARPLKPEVVPPREVPTPKASPLPLNAHVLHNLAHIELNAIDLAWDTVVRFSGGDLPPAFYSDFARVADDESRHLLWCLQRLGELGHAYGDMPAHNLLWEGAEATAGDLRGRLAVVPMSQEARGLDSGTRLAEKLVGWGDNRTAAIVQRIASEERAHVAVGVAWFRAVCGALGDAEPGAAYRALLSELCPDLLKGPFNDSARQDVGLERGWYDPQRWPEAALGGSGGTGGAAGGLPPRLDLPRLQSLRHRLQGLLAQELHGEALAEAC